MPFFGGLANETILQIINATSAGDISSLASCCKHFNFLAQGRLAFHRQKRAEAEEILVGYDLWETSAIHPLKHVQDILEDDDCRFYTRVMKIGSLAYGDPDDDEPGDEGASHIRNKNALVDNIEAQYGDEITTLVTKVYTALLPYAAETSLEKWIEEVLYGEPAAVVILLLALHPNLEILHIHEPGQDWWREIDGAELPWGNLFNSLTTAALAPATNTLKVFSRLSCFRLSGLGDDGGMEASPEMFIPFMALPTMREIVGRVVDDHDLSWPYGMGTSEVTTLDLEGDIDTVSLSNVIRGLKVLREFRYQFSSPVSWSKSDRGRDYMSRLKWGPRTKNDAANNDPDDGESSDEDEDGYFSDNDISEKPRWEPRAIATTLLQCASNSLVSLNLTAGGFKGVVKFSGHDPFIGSLRSFQVLKYVCIDTTMLFKKVKCFGNVSLARAKGIQRTSWEEIRAQWLVDFLPMSIESFELTHKYVGKALSKADVATMFTGLPALRDRLPNLFEICIEKTNDDEQNDKERDDEVEGWKELGSRCEQNAIELFTIDHHESLY